MHGRHTYAVKAKSNYLINIVTLKMDDRDVSNPHGIPVIEFAPSSNELGKGIQAVTYHCIISSGKGRN